MRIKCTFHATTSWLSVVISMFESESCDSTSKWTQFANERTDEEERFDVLANLMRHCFVCDLRPSEIFNIWRQPRALCDAIAPRQNPMGDYRPHNTHAHFVLTVQLRIVSIRWSYIKCCTCIIGHIEWVLSFFELGSQRELVRGKPIVCYVRYKRDDCSHAKPQCAHLCTFIRHTSEYNVSSHKFNNCERMI